MNFIFMKCLMPLSALFFISPESTSLWKRLYFEVKIHTILKMSHLSKSSYIFSNISKILRKAQGGQVRCSSYRSSLFLEEIEPATTKYEVTKDPEEWKFVERILPLATVPEPLKKQVYPSGWKPQGDNFQNQPYFVERTKNHMIPVYMKIMQRGIKRHTFVRKIHGDIWLLEKEIKEFLQKDSYRPIRSQVNEFARFIRISGDHVNAIKYWVEQKNF